MGQGRLGSSSTCGCRPAGVVGGGPGAGLRLGADPPAAAADAVRDPPRRERGRSPREHLIFKAGHVFEQWMRSFLLGRGFTELHTPKLTGAASESGAEVFRVEPSFTARYATEFTGLDLEMAWIDSVDDVMRMEEEMLAHAIAAVRDSFGHQFEEVFGADLVIPAMPFPRITLVEARKQLLRAGWRPADRSTEDLDGEGERMLSKLVAEKF